MCCMDEWEQINKVLFRYYTQIITPSIKPANWDKITSRHLFRYNKKYESDAIKNELKKRLPLYEVLSR